MHEEYGEFSPEEKAALDKVWEQERLLNEAEQVKSRTRAKVPKQVATAPKRPTTTKRPRKSR